MTVGKCHEEWVLYPQAGDSMSRKLYAASCSGTLTAVSDVYSPFDPAPLDHPKPLPFSIQERPEC